MNKTEYDARQLEELVYQALETELGGVQIYTQAIECAINDDLKKEWHEYLAQTTRHCDVLTRVCQELGLDPAKRTPGREVVAHIGQSLVQAMRLALKSGDRAAAQLVAGECVVLAETKDHQNWELLSHVVEHGQGDAVKILKLAVEAVEDEEDHHLYHTTGWTRELWLESLGFPAVLPPPEEVRQVSTKIGAAHAAQQREKLM